MTESIIKDITQFIFISDKPQRSDVIFLPGSSDPAIPEKAAGLYGSGFAPILIPSGGVSVKTGKFGGVKRQKDLYNGDYQTDCDFYADVLAKNGVPASAVLREDKSGFTKENALFSRKKADENHLIVHKALIVCKSFHARRCQICYQLAFPEAEIRVIPVDVYGISSENWYTQAYGIERVCGELSRCGSQFVDEIKTFSERQFKQLR